MTLNIGNRYLPGVGEIIDWARDRILSSGGAR